MFQSRNFIKTVTVEDKSAREVKYMQSGALMIFQIFNWVLPCQIAPEQPSMEVRLPNKLRKIIKRIFFLKLTVCLSFDSMKVII